MKKARGGIVTSELLTEGTNLMIVGMGTVFVFLTILVGAVTLMSKMAMKIEAMLPAPPEPVKRVTAAAGVSTDHRGGAALSRHPLLLNICS